MADTKGLLERDKIIMDMMEDRSEEMSESEENTEEAEFSPAEQSCSSCATSDMREAEDFDIVQLSPSLSDGERLCTEGVPRLSEMVMHSTNMHLRPFTTVQRLYIQFDDEVVMLPPLQADAPKDAHLPCIFYSNQ